MDFENNVLYLSYDGMTDPLGQSQVLPYIIGLSKLGYNFTLISAEKKNLFTLHQCEIAKICNENNIDWQPIIYTKSPPVISTLKDLNKIKSRSIHLHFQKKFVLVHCRGYISAHVGQYMKKKFRTGFLFDMRGLWPDEKVNSGAWNLKNPLFKLIYNYYKEKEKQFFLEADYVVSLTQRGKDEILSWVYMQNATTKIEIIPCATDSDHFDYHNISLETRTKFAQHLSIEESDTVICYLGSIGTWYMLDEMLDFFKQFLIKKPSSKMLFITASEHDLIKERCKAKQIPEQKVVLRKATRKEVPILLSLCHYSIFFIKATYSKLSSSPTKQGELMAMGIPIVCNMGVGDTDGIVQKFNSGVVIKKFTPQEYDAAIEKLLFFNFDKKKIRDGAVSFFSLSDAIKKYKNIYTTIKK